MIVFCVTMMISMMMMMMMMTMYNEMKTMTMMMMMALICRVMEALQGTMDKTNLGQGSLLFAR